MNADRTKERVKKDLKSLFRSLDFVSNHFLKGRRKRSKEDLYFNIYQGLGLAWEFLGLQCKHWDGYKLNKEGRELCRICGKVKGIRDQFFLILADGAKNIGIRVVPNSKEVFEDKSKAQLVRDKIVFHGAALDVDVHNSYKSRLFGKEREITIAADRTVALMEDGITCSVDPYVINVRAEPQSRNRRPRYGGFPWELSKEKLRHFPVIFRFGDRYKFLGLTILRPARRSRYGRGGRRRGR